MPSASQQQPLHIVYALVVVYALCYPVADRAYQSINQSMLRNKRKADTRMAHLPPLLRHSKELKFGIGDGNLQYYL